MASALPKILRQCVGSCRSLRNSTKLYRRLESAMVSSSSCISTLTNPNMFTFSSLKSQRSFFLQPLTYSNFPESKFHVQSDADFSDMLIEEIKAEKERMLEIPQVSDGWSLNRSGSDCKLKKALKQDNIQVSFNVNASIPPLDSEDPDEEQEIVAQPDFTVEITKPSNECLSFECYFPDDDGEVHENIFSIRSVYLHRGELLDSTYVIDTDNIDRSVYNRMLTYLQERGISNDFAEELIDLATAIENHEYIGSLEKLQKFVSSK